MSLSCNGWTIYLYALFAEQLTEQIALVRKLKSKLEREAFVQHPEVKLLKALQEGIKNKIPLEPFAIHFRLRKPLEKYCRLKRMGLPDRYRLFFRASTENKEKVIVVLWLGYPRKEGDKKDCYTVFKKLVARGDFPSTVGELIVKSKGGLAGF